MSDPNPTPGLIPAEIRAELASSSPDYFVILGLPSTLQVDRDLLQKQFYERSRLLHPDRFARASAQDRADSLQASSLLNDGYRTLRNPIARAEWVLSRHGFDIGEQRSNNVPPELLEEVFELNMALEELRAGDEDARPQLEGERERFLEMERACDIALEEQFAQWDQTQERETLMAMRALLNRRRYIQNLVRDVEKALAGA